MTTNNCLVENPSMQPRRDYEDYLRFVKDNHMPAGGTEASIDSIEDVPAPKTPMPNKNMSLTAEAFDKSRKTVDVNAIEKPKLPVPKNRTMSNFRTGREMRTLNPFSTAKKSLMNGKLE